MLHKLIGLFLVIFFSFPGNSISEVKNSKTVFVLFDLSGSTVKDQIREEYLKNFEKILDIETGRRDFNESKIRPGDVMVAGIISDKSLSSGTLPIMKEFKEFSSWGDNKLIFTQKFNRDKKETIDTAQKLLFSNIKTKQTDIIGSLRIAERVFKNFKREKAVLVIMSDMVEESPDYNFNRGHLNDKRIEEIIAKEKKNGLPDLKGVNIIVTGAGTQSDTKDKFREIEKFWTRYANSCGAVLEEKDYGRAFMGLRGY